jgi:cysteinyl-tRNA synthetase
VISVINYTDIDDRIIVEAAKAGVGELDHVERVIAGFRRDCRGLKIKDYAAYTRATDFVAEQVAAVQALLDKGHAYESEGEVLYDVRSFPRYGELSGNKLDDMQEGASGRLDEAETARKRFAADFTLWKPSKPGEPSWPTGHEAWPQGRPGWHIECSVMSTVMLGDHFDVHGGGIDNLFPHHENEVAQAEPLCGHPWVGTWMHPAHLQLVDEHGSPVKMSKSLGNVISIPALLERQGADEVRWFYGVTHYRTPLAFSWQLLAETGEGFKKIKRAVAILASRLVSAMSAGQAITIPVVSPYASLRAGEQAIPRERPSFEHGVFGERSRVFIERFIAALDDDMGTPKASAAVFDYVNELFAGGIETLDDPPSLLAAYRCLTRHLWVLGVELADERLYPELVAESLPAGGGDSKREQALSGVIDRLLELRQQARKAKDFARSDLIRDLLKDAGVQVEDTPKGPRWDV